MNKIIQDLKIQKLIKFFIIFIGFFLIFSIYKNLEDNSKNFQTITIKGQAEKEISPDSSRIIFSVNEYNKNQETASKNINKKIKNIKDNLLKMGVEEKRIKDLNYSISPRYNWNDGKRIFDSYFATQRVEVVTKDIEKSSKILEVLIKNKADNVEGPNFFIENLEDKKNDLRKEAIENAKNKAKILSKDLGVKIEKIVGFYEIENNNFYPVAYRSQSLEKVSEDISEPVLNQGLEKVKKEIQITFQIEN